MGIIIVKSLYRTLVLLLFFSIIACSKEGEIKCLSCDAAVGFFPGTTTVKYEYVEYCEGNSLSFMGTAYPNLNELQLAISAMGGRHCIQFTK